MSSRIFIYCLLLSAWFGVQAQAADCKNASSADQQIIRIRPDAAASTQTIAIEGKGLGEQLQQAKVKIGGQDAIINSWEDNLILAVVPNGIPVGKANIEVDIKADSSVSCDGGFEVKAPQYDESAFEVMTGVGASFLPVESTSYKIDTTNNALSQSTIARKHIELLLGGGFILPWPRLKGMGGDPSYKDFHPLESFLSIRFAPGADQTFTGFVVGGGYRIHKYFSLLVGYSLTPIDEPTSGFRRAAAQVVAANPTIFPYNHFNANDLANNKVGAFDGFPLFLYDANGVTTTKIFPTSPTVTHHHSGIFFGVGIPVNLSSLLRPSGGK